MGPVKLTSGCLERIMGFDETPTRPVVQVVDVKVLVQTDGAKRVKLMLSDGKTVAPGILATPLTYMVDENKLRKFSVVTLVDYLPNGLTGKKFIIIVDMQIESHETNQLGSTMPMAASGAVNPQTNLNQAQQRVYAQNSAVSGSNEEKGAAMSERFAQKPVINKPVVKTAQNVGDASITPIRGLNPYASRWTLQCRVLSKDPIRQWDKGPNNQGKLFSISLLDSEESEIRATFFKDAVDKFYDYLEVGKVYNFSTGQIKLANKRFNNTNCDYEISFNSNAEIIPVDDSAMHNSGIKSVSMKPTKIKDINTEITGLIDVVGVVVNWGNIETFTSKAGKEITKLDVNLADDSKQVIRCTIFGEKCAEFEKGISQANQDFGAHKMELEPGSFDERKLIVCAVKGVKVSDFQGCGIGLLPGSQIYINPDIKERRELINWVKSGVHMNELKSKSNVGEGGAGIGARRGSGSFVDRKTAKEINALEDIRDEKGAYVSLKGTVTVIKKETMNYPACPEEGNNKKVIEQPDGTWFCESTGQSYSNCRRRYILTMLVSDHTDGVWVTCFNDQAEMMIGRSADELHQIKEENEDMFDAILLNANFQEFLFTIRCKNEFYRDESRKRCTVVNMDRIDYEVETKQMLEFIEMHH